MSSTDIRNAIPRASTKTGRFFNDNDAIKKDIERFTHLVDEASSETLVSAVLKLYAHGIASYVGKRTLELTDALEARIAALEKTTPELLTHTRRTVQDRGSANV